MPTRSKCNLCNLADLILITVVYKCNNEAIKQINKETVHGIVFESQLEFHVHTALVVRKANRFLALILINVIIL